MEDRDLEQSSLPQDLATQEWDKVTLDQGQDILPLGQTTRNIDTFIEGEDVSDRIQGLPLNHVTQNGMNDNTEYELNLSLVGKGHGQTESPLPIDPVPEDIIPDSDADEEGNGQDE